MNKYISYISVLMLGTVGLSSCNDNWETPPMVYPEATMQANVGLDALKTKYWSTDRNSVNTVGTAGDITSNAELAGDSAIFRGRVISESASGNIYNSIVVQGEGCALNISVRTNKLTAIPAFGQEIFVNITGMKIGNYNGLMQLGAEGSYNGAPSMTFMESADFEAKMQINGMPDPSKVDTVLITLPEIADKSSATLQKYQSQLVRIDGLTFSEPGQPFAGSQNTNRAAKDAQGNTINVRTSSYASFKNSLVPTGTGTVVGILSYFGNDWQLLLNDITGIIGFDETTNPDNPDNPPAMLPARAPQPAPSTPSRLLSSPRLSPPTPPPSRNTTSRVPSPPSRSSAPSSATPRTPSPARALPQASTSSAATTSTVTSSPPRTSSRSATR